MLKTAIILKKILNSAELVVAVCAFISFLALAPAQADDIFTVSSHALQQALITTDHVDLYTPGDRSGLNFGSSYYSGLASGVTPVDNFADIGNNQRLYALLIDGRYDFNYETQSLSSPLRPYISGGLGMATSPVGGNSLTGGSNEMVPLFRLGGGIAYRLDQRWDLSLDYKAGIATPSSGDQVFTGRGQQPVDLQALSLGMRYAF